jgi:hypothetical protein
MPIVIGNAEDNEVNQKVVLRTLRPILLSKKGSDDKPVAPQIIQYENAEYFFRDIQKGTFNLDAIVVDDEMYGASLNKKSLAGRYLGRFLRKNVQELQTELKALDEGTPTTILTNENINLMQSFPFKVGDKGSTPDVKATPLNYREILEKRIATYKPVHVVMNSATLDDNDPSLKGLEVFFLGKGTLTTDNLIKTFKDSPFQASKPPLGRASSTSSVSEKKELGENLVLSRAASTVGLTGHKNKGKMKKPSKPSGLVPLSTSKLVTAKASSEVPPTPLLTPHTSIIPGSAGAPETPLPLSNIDVDVTSVAGTPLSTSTGTPSVTPTLTSPPVNPLALSFTNVTSPSSSPLRARGMWNNPNGSGVTPTTSVEQEAEQQLSSSSAGLYRQQT